MKTPFVRVIFALTPFPFLALLEVPLEKAAGPGIQMGASFISFLLFLWGLIEAKNQKSWGILTGGVGIVLFVGYCWRNPVSENLFLGQPIGRAYYAEAPGFIELTVYENQDCIITYGGPIGAALKSVSVGRRGSHNV